MVGSKVIDRSLYWSYCIEYDKILEVWCINWGRLFVVRVFGLWMV